MLCSFCEGTEHSPRPHSLLNRFAGPVMELSDCTSCGKHLWEDCPACAGEGCKLHIFGQCSRCGNSILYWLQCADCRGAGKLYQPAHNCVPERAPKVTRIRPPAIAPRHKNGGTQIGL